MINDILVYMNNKVKKILVIIVVFLLLVGGGAAAYIYSIVSTGFEIDKTVYVYVDQNKSYDQLVQTLTDSAKIEDIGNFNVVASYRRYPGNMRTGRYAISPKDDVWTVVNKLNRGLQTPTKVTFNNMRLKSDLVSRVSSQLMFDEKELAALLDDSIVCASYGFTPQSIVAMFIPNTYEFYWDIKPEKFVDKMKTEYDSFWNQSRLDKARALDLTPLEVSTLASIVEEECMYSDEYPMVAGLYLNRLRRGQLLQADPTVKYAVGDFSLQRILFKHLEVDSPYNTYQYKGLPPSPIRIPTIKGLDAVLNYTDHNYLYMCAKEDFSGRHNFATTLAEHNRNAAKYRTELNKRGIY